MTQQVVCDQFLSNAKPPQSNFSRLGQSLYQPVKTQKQIKQKSEMIQIVSTFTELLEH